MSEDKSKKPSQQPKPHKREAPKPRPQTQREHLRKSIGSDERPRPPKPKK